ncbi:TPA: ATP synthase F1 subunit epsilon [candidate division CPR2 bacterium]|uniref:ATP synthase epsilon chain n=1 Tax=candidate division CPR2 bacterium GW2011_GWC1_41_48 TaxID=1618344 RepID=A0A0G0Z9G8_UNCC2|nr:MAG: ATP synthase epsilon chain [candidate division CPR2 bacterium GW2011_GWC2_39_35]KKS09673.1 MAG: hypothetical protein UU65_C0001G0078 [candidate division CPR2 bacterium GW2011_GWC1_41_48]HBG81470.1 ATP synthase F1 subunit epsilon [candidate division CPR2 bacterium]HCL99565.1 ATP synthase F1 subunit epsilon [candidate division CPR2 bacterium]
MQKLHLKITTPERVLVDEEAREVIVPTKSGQISILPSHTALVAEITPGEMLIRNEKEEKVALVYGGFVEVQEGSKVIILADSAEHLHELSEKEAEEARNRAETLMQEVRDDKERFADAEAELARSLIQLKLLKKHHSHRHTKLN